MKIIIGMYAVPFFPFYSVFVFVIITIIFIIIFLSVKSKRRGSFYFKRRFKNNKV